MIIWSFYFNFYVDFSSDGDVGVDDADGNVLDD